jgi:hypothetical protein
MTMDIDLVYERITAAVNDAEIPGLTKNVVATAFSPDAPTPPHFFLAEFVGDYDADFGEDMNLTITARLMLSRAGEETGQQEGRQLAGRGANTIIAALEAVSNIGGHSALGGAASDIHLRRVTGPRLYDFGEAHFYGLEFTIFVLG